MILFIHYYSLGIYIYIYDTVEALLVNWENEKIVVICEI